MGGRQRTSIFFDVEKSSQAEKRQEVEREKKGKKGKAPRA